MPYTGELYTECKTHIGQYRPKHLRPSAPWASTLVALMGGGHGDP